MDGEEVDVVSQNEHLGNIVSGFKEEETNILENLTKGRRSLYSLLGPAFSNESLLNPSLQMHLFRMFTCPITRSGLSALSIRPTHAQPLVAFHRKTMRSFLHLSDRSPIPSFHFLLGEVPILGRLDRDVFSLFYSIWSNPDTKLHKIVDYLLRISEENSRTWSVHCRLLCKQYGIQDPLSLLQKPPPAKNSWKRDVEIAITTFYENKLREDAENNSKMAWFNINLIGLAGKPHPILKNITTTHDVKKLRIVIKMICGDYYTYELRGNQNGTSVHCRICLAPSESIIHVVALCPGTSEPRQRITSELETCLVPTSNDSSIFTKSLTKDEFLHLTSNDKMWTQFLIDCSSYNLPDWARIDFNDKNLNEIFKLCRDMLYSIHSMRLAKLKIIDVEIKRKSNS